MRTKHKLWACGVLAGMMMLASMGFAEEGAEGRGGRRGKGDFNRRGPGGPGRGGHGEGMLLKMSEKLGLSDEQVAQIKKIIEGNKESREAQHKKMAAAHEALRKAAEAGEEDAIRKAAAEVGKLLGDGAVMRSATRTQVQAILTPEQQKKAEALREEFKKRMGERKERFKKMRERRGEHRRKGHGDAKDED